jgi:hypothetical protein
VAINSSTGISTHSYCTGTKFLGLSRKEHPYAQLRHEKSKFNYTEVIQIYKWEVHTVLHKLCVSKALLCLKSFTTWYFAIRQIIAPVSKHHAWRGMGHRGKALCFLDLGIRWR